jgi:hypothetical protein
MRIQHPEATTEEVSEAAEHLIEFSQLSLEEMFGEVI